MTSGRTQRPTTKHPIQTRCENPERPRDPRTGGPRQHRASPSSRCAGFCRPKPDLPSPMGSRRYANLTLPKGHFLPTMIQELAPSRLTMRDPDLPYPSIRRGIGPVPPNPSCQTIRRCHGRATEPPNTPSVDNTRLRPATHAMHPQHQSVPLVLHCCPAHRHPPHPRAAEARTSWVKSMFRFR